MATAASDAAALAALQKEDSERWAQVAKASNIKLE